MKSLKYSKNYQNVKQRYTVTKCCWKNGIYGLVQHRIATNLQFVKKKKKKYYLQTAREQGMPIFFLSCVLHYHIIQKFKDVIEEITYI